MALRRGFKAEAERLAKDIWSAMGLRHSDRMEAVKLANTWAASFAPRTHSSTSRGSRNSSESKTTRSSPVRSNFPATATPSSSTR